MCNVMFIICTCKQNVSVAMSETGQFFNLKKRNTSTQVSYVTVIADIITKLSCAIVTVTRLTQATKWLQSSDLSLSVLASVEI